ncbi:hypothetical protein AD945_10020 [Gluconobacter albidus]|uniref:Uncharacterized protein n=1 Tax=Gluconobacter albidus TaxID=318683 RepID=A0A149THI9_9PROT|nr:hypothetical protein [Gluconobacter albidus]KXV47380.1 hypothetical protein AD945_10020 [Gluconobacter albidus]
MLDRVGMTEVVTEGSIQGECAPPVEASRHEKCPIGEKGAYVRFPEPLDAKAICESARIKPDLHNQVRRYSSGMTLVEGGGMKMPAQWGSSHG